VPSQAKEAPSTVEKNPAVRGGSRRLRKRRSSQHTRKPGSPLHIPGKKDNATPEEKDASITAAPPLEPITPASPMDLDFGGRHRRPSTGGSAEAEDITALPGSKALRTSPHLRPVTQESKPYNWNLSHHSLPNQNAAASATQRRGKLQRNPSRNKRAATYDLPLARRRSSKKRKNDQLREEEIRAMSAPIDVPKRGTGGDVLQRESRKSRGPLNRNFERPTSIISLPLEDSIHSSMSGEAEPRNYRLSVLNIISPRPTIRLKDTARSRANDTASSNLLRNTSRSDKAPGKAMQTWQPTKIEETIIERARIDSLADEMDSTELRDILERDRKRKEKKRDRDTEHLKRKLEKRAEKQRTKEWAVQQRAESATVKRQRPAHDDLGIQAAEEQEKDKHMADEPDFHMEDVQTEDAFEDAKEVQEPLKDSEKATLALEDIHPALRPPPAEVHPAFRNQAEEIPRMPMLSSNDDDDDDHGRATPMSEIGTPIDTPAIDTAHAVSYTAARPTNSRPITPLSPVTSSVYHGDRMKASKILGADVAGGSYTVSNTALDATAKPKEEAVNKQSPPRREKQVKHETEPLSASKKKGGFLASLFKTRRRSSSAAPKDVTREASFSNASREEMSRSIPAHLVQQPSSALQFKKAGPPLRTTSIFREDLPESPLSPPDSRVQSPIDVGALSSKTASRRAQRIPSTIMTEGSSRVGSPIDAAQRPESPLSGKASGLMSHSLASVDSEASWLSGKPQRHTSTARKRGSFGAGSLGRGENFNGSYEELGIPEDEYFRRLNTPSRGNAHASGLSVAVASSQQASSTALRSPGLASKEEEPGSSVPNEEQVVSHAGASRHPIVVHRDTRHKSSEGLLNQYLSTDALTTTDVEMDEDNDKTPEAEYPTPAVTPTGERSSEEITPVQRATSVNLGKGHARNMSAGSAKLLDIRRGSASLSSTPNLPGTPQRGSI
jgi:hypothetical protein